MPKLVQVDSGGEYVVRMEVPLVEFPRSSGEVELLHEGRRSRFLTSEPRWSPPVSGLNSPSLWPRTSPLPCLGWNRSFPSFGRSRSVIRLGCAGEVSRADAMFAATKEWAGHYSQLAVYLRLNGLLLPPAKKRQE
jgi:hypothetical protein